MTSATIQLKLDWRLVSVGLLAVLVGVLVWAKPWVAKAPARTISVTGQATVRHEPDLFSFQPIYQDADAAKVTTTGNAVVAKLKELGVKAADIKTSASANEAKPELLIYPRQPSPTTATSVYTIAITVYDKPLAQKVGDYLATTNATGQITPSASFAKSTRTQLELEARKLASDDAKAKARVMAGQLGARLGKVIKISDSLGYGMSYAEAGKATDMSQSTTPAGPTVMPGTDEVAYSFNVEFELR